MYFNTLATVTLGLSALAFAAPAEQEVSVPAELAEFASLPPADLNVKAVDAAQAGCATGVHMIVARASTEAQGTGTIGTVVQMVLRQVPGSDYEAVRYPASLTDYVNSETQGLNNAKQMLQSYVQKCPKSKVVLMGYSQGAQIVGDTICGRSSALSSRIPPASDEAKKNIVAVVQMGDPTHVPGTPGNVGTARSKGWFPRTDISKCKDILSTKTASYCDSSDLFCDSGLNVITHLAYSMTRGTQAANFIANKAKSAKIQ